MYRIPALASMRFPLSASPPSRRSPISSEGVSLAPEPSSKLCEPSTSKRSRLAFARAHFRPRPSGSSTAFDSICIQSTSDLSARTEAVRLRGRQQLTAGAQGSHSHLDVGIDRPRAVIGMCQVATPLAGKTPPRYPFTHFVAQIGMDAVERAVERARSLAGGMRPSPARTHLST